VVHTSWIRDIHINKEKTLLRNHDRTLSLIHAREIPKPDFPDSAMVRLTGQISLSGVC